MGSRRIHQHTRGGVGTLVDSIRDVVAIAVLATAGRVNQGARPAVGAAIDPVGYAVPIAIGRAATSVHLRAGRGSGTAVPVIQDSVAIAVRIGLLPSIRLTPTFTPKLENLMVVSLAGFDPGTVVVPRLGLMTPSARNMSVGVNPMRAPSPAAKVEVVPQSFP